MKQDVLARIIYDRYCDAVGGKAFNGDALPKSEEFFSDPNKDKQANAWRVATKEVQNLLLEITQNLGHSAYGHSSSATIGIDSLREKAFDFLGVPKE